MSLSVSFVCHFGDLSFDSSVSGCSLAEIPYHVLFSQLAGGVVMAVGVWTLVEKSDYISLLPSKTYAVSAYILVLAGAIVMVTGVLGCCATFKEQRKLLRMVRDQVREER